MRKRFLQALALCALLMTLLSFFAVSPALALSHHAASPKIANSDLLCHYTVTATAGLNVRSGPFIQNNPSNIVYVLNYQQVVTAYKDHLATGSGYTWRQLLDGNWAVTNWLQWDGGACFM